MPYVESEGVPIYYEVIGDGFPIVLQTGGGGDGTMWVEGGYVAGLDEFRCILLDHRGHGRSGRPLDPAAHRVEQYAADVLAVLDSLQIDRAAYWGYSAGATVGYALAATRPDRVAALIASGVIGSTDLDAPEERRDAELMADEARRRGLGTMIAEAGEEAGETYPPWFLAQMAATDDEMFALQLLAARAWHGPWSVLPRIKCPVLMLVGALEDPEGHNQRAASSMARARCATFPDLDHITAYVRSDLALAEAVPFLREIADAELASAGL
jgi:pimeloyl-ACP methyl ester carboxylesterase